MWSNNTYMIWFMQYEKLTSSNLTQIDVKTLIMDRTYILSLISGLKEKKKYKLLKPLSSKVEYKIDYA